MKNKNSTLTKKIRDFKELPTDCKMEGNEIRRIYASFRGLTKSALSDMGCVLPGRYEDFLEFDLEVWKAELALRLESKKSEASINIKERNSIYGVWLVLDCAFNGHWKLQDAYMSLKYSDRASYAMYLAEAGVMFGQLLMIKKLTNDGIFNRIGSLISSLSGATKGGLRSGAQRRTQSKVPEPTELRAMRAKMLESSINNPRDIASKLAKKYMCTPDYIRKRLKEE
jgi:hypothetical protein